MKNDLSLCSVGNNPHGMQLLWAQIREGQLWSVHRAVGRGHGEGAAGVLQVHEDRQGAGGQRLRDTRGSRGLRQVPG